VVGDVEHAGYGEIEPGTPLREVIDRLGGGVRDGRRAKAVLSGVSNPVLTEADLDAPVSYDGLAAAGGGLGSAGFVVYDDTRSMLAVARMVSRFLYVESCGQCRACKYGCGEITRRLDDLAGPRRRASDIEVIGARLRDVTSQNRCFLGEEEQRVISSLLREFPDDFAVDGAGALDPAVRRAGSEVLPVPKIVDIRDGVALYDERQLRKQPDWTYV
jgi:NADH:ubiquinone oxidoreductase subunit F (NADH-binding)